MIPAFEAITAIERLRADSIVVSTMTPKYITDTRSAVLATTPMLCVINRTDMPNRSRKCLISSRICA